MNENGGGLGLPPVPPDRHPQTSTIENTGWPTQLDLTALHRPARGPLDDDFDYPSAFLTIDLDELADDVDTVLTTSQDWWPADHGHYGPLILRMAWHCAGTYRVGDGRGGARWSLQRFGPVGHWPDNRNLDKARRLLWPVKKKYGRRLSWPDLMVFAGNRALETMGFTTLGYAGGREEVLLPDPVYWGPETAWLGDERHTGVRDLENPLAADQMGLIYVNPEGPHTVPDPVTSARDIRSTFARMGMDDEETVALIAGGHTFGKTHGAADPEKHLGDARAGWPSSHRTGRAGDTITSGLEGTWTPTPTSWDNTYLETLFAYEWDVTLSPGGLWQWVPRGGAGAGTVPDAHDPSRRHGPVFLTTDLALRFDPVYEPIARRFLNDPARLADAFARAWFKLTHIDLGPRSGYLGKLVPTEVLPWQDPLPGRTHDLVTPGQIALLKDRVLTCGLGVGLLVATAWASASTYRESDRRGGSDGGRVRLDPQRGWAVSTSFGLEDALGAFEGIRDSISGFQISMADLVVLAGCAAVERAALDAGIEIEVPFRPGRTDATRPAFAMPEPLADGFLNHRAPGGSTRPSERLLVDRAALLTLTPAETAVLVGGLRVLGAGHPRLGRLTSRVGVLSNDFFVSLLDNDRVWTAVGGKNSPPEVFEGRDRVSGELLGRAGRADLVFTTDPELRAIAEVYAGDDALDLFVRNFVAAWDKVMSLGFRAVSRSER